MPYESLHNAAESLRLPKSCSVWSYTWGKTGKLVPGTLVVDSQSRPTAGIFRWQLLSFIHSSQDGIDCLLGSAGDAVLSQVFKGLQKLLRVS